MEQISLKDKFNDYINYLIIGVLSIVALFFLPSLASPLGLALNLPDTTAGWLVWAGTRTCIAIINLVLLYAFLAQGKVNVKDNPYYIEAEEIMERGLGRKEKHPRSPGKWYRQQYGIKGGIIFLMTGLSLITLTQAILIFDWVAFLTYLFTIIMGLVFGVINMKKAEIYWTVEYWQYAKEYEKEHLNDNN